MQGVSNYTPCLSLCTTILRYVPSRINRPAISMAVHGHDLGLEQRAGPLAGSSVGAAPLCEGTSVAERISKRILGRRFARGFSLVELMLSVLILCVLVAISLPTLMRAYRSYQLNDAATRFSDTLKTT